MKSVSENILSSGQALAIFLQGLLYAGLVACNLYLITGWLGEPFELPYRVFAALSFLLGFLVFRRVNLFNAWDLGEMPQLGTRLTLAWFFLVASLFFIAFLGKLTDGISRAVVLWWTLTTPVLLLAAHAMVRLLVVRVFSAQLRRRRAAIVFVSDATRQLVESVAKDRYSRFEVVGYYEDRSQDRTGVLPDIPNLGNSADLVPGIKEHGIEAVFIVLPEIGIERARKLIDQLDNTTASIYYVPDLFVLDLTKARVSDINGVPVLQINETPFWGVDGILKRVFDLLLGGLLFMAAMPLMLLIGLAIKLDDGGPVLFRQARCGINGGRFWVHKFRTMRVTAQPAQAVFEPHATLNDPRVTRVGRFLRRTSLDELPQFIDVLKGDMSLVGPRPHALSHDEHYSGEVRRYLGRHKVPPGVTGWAQINGLRGEIKSLDDMERRIAYDLEYIRNWSPAMDLKIMLLTVPRMLRDPAAY